MRMKPGLFFLIFFTWGLLHADQVKPVMLDTHFYLNLIQSNPIARERQVEALLQKICLGQALIESIDKSSHYKRKYRIVLSDPVAATLGLTIHYHLYLNDIKELDTAQKGDQLEFKGQIIMYAPLNLNRTIYIIEILMETGNIILQ